MKTTPLGKKTEYESFYNPEVLFPIERSVNRKKSSIDENAFMGYDIWNCYEFSFLNEKGKPLVFRLRIVYRSDSKFIVESKSLKLYLNGFSMTNYRNQAEVAGIIKKDLTNILAAQDVIIELFGNSVYPSYERIEKKHLIDNIDAAVNEYDLNPELLETRSGRNGSFKYFSDLLKTNCPVTGQPDWASVSIEFRSSLSLKKESLLRYIASFRNHQDYHENCCELIFTDIQKKCKPEFLIVKCFFTRRGGIEINPVRYAGKVPLSGFDHHYWRQ